MRNVSSNSSTTTTMTITTEEHVEKEKDSTSKKPKIMSLKLKGTKKESEKDQEKGTCRHIHWSQDTIDNENMNKKKSNLCCIFHPNDQDDCDCDDPFTKDVELPEGKNVYDYQPKYSKK